MFHSVAAGVHCTFLSWWPWPFTSDLDIQTRPSEGPNTSSLWIWCKCVQPFQRYLIHKQTNKKVTNSAKNRTLLACGNKRQRLSNIADLTCKKQHFIIRDVSSNIADLTCKKQHFIIHDVSGRRLASLAQDCNALYSHPPSTLMDHCKACRQTTFNHTSSSN